MKTKDRTDIEELKADHGTTNGVSRHSSPSAPRLSIDQIMLRVRAEVSKRRNGCESVPSAPADVHSFEQFRPRWQPAVPRLPVKNEYAVSELLAFSDSDFIDVAYRTILRRPPDEDGFNHYLQLLRTGTNTKVEILATLSSCSEGQAAGVRISGLRWPHSIQKWRRKRFIGPIVAWAHALLRLGKLADRQATLDTSLCRESQEIGRLVNDVVEHMLERILMLKVQLSDRPATAAFEVLRREHAETIARIGRLETSLVRELAERPDQSAFRALKDEHSAMAEHLTQLQAAFARGLEGRAAFEALKTEHAAALTRMAEVDSLVLEKLHVQEAQQESLAGRIESTAASIQHLLNLEKRTVEDARALDPFYVGFEDRFRGDRSLIRTRVEPYLALIRGANAGTAGAPVVDVGCGRGDWLEVLRDNGLIGRGIEINRVFIDMCRGRGLEVIEGDAVESLRAMPEGSVGAVTSIHMVEHFTFERMIALLDQARRVLRSGGVLLLETPNPENLTVAHHWFYIDPTHRNPLPPEALRWIVEARGFHCARIERLVEAREMNAPPLLQEDVPGAASVNAVLALLSVAPDYAIVALRP